MHEQYHFQPKCPGDFVEEGNGKCVCNLQSSLWPNSPCPWHPKGPCVELALRHGSTRSCQEVLEAYSQLIRYNIRPTLPEILHRIHIPAALAMMRGIINISDANMKELSAILCFDCAPSRAEVAYEDFRRNMIYRDFTKAKAVESFTWIGMNSWLHWMINASWSILLLILTYHFIFLGQISNT